MVCPLWMTILPATICASTNISEQLLNLPLDCILILRLTFPGQTPHSSTPDISDLDSEQPMDIEDDLVPPAKSALDLMSNIWCAHLQCMQGSRISCKHSL